jgi:23S rRNA pseudouridine1911/1915/1917 synthase
MALNHGYAYRAQVGPDAAHLTLVEWLTSNYAHSTAQTWRARIERGELRVDGERAVSDVRVRAGQTVVWQRPPWDEPDVPLTFDVAYEDAHIVAVSKPSGLPTMPAGGFLDHTLLAIVRERFGEVHPVHRLGRGTSGLVVFARTRQAATSLTSAWRTHAVSKVYRALVSGDPPWTILEIATPIGPVAHPLLGTVHAASPEGRAAHTTATVIERRGGTALCDVSITTGRPHQIRIHLAAAGHPLVGDPLYVEGGRLRAHTHVLPGDGGYLLHAHRVQLAHPEVGRSLDLVAPPPTELQAAAERARGQGRDNLDAFGRARMTS